MDSPEISFLIRGTNGQIGYISDGLAMPEFFNLVLSKDKDKRVLTDFSPVIEALHQLHKQAHEKAILTKYNIMYDFWLGVRNQTREKVKELKCIELVNKSQELVLELQNSLKERKSDFDPGKQTTFDFVGLIKKDADIYIDSLLCHIYAEAWLDIDSLKADVVITKYADFLVEFIDGLYRSLLREGNFQNSLLKFIAFEQPEKLQAYLALDSDESANSFKLRCLGEFKPQPTDIQIWERWSTIKEVKIQYDNFHYTFVQAIEILRDLLYKARSLKKLVEILKQGNLEWDAREEAVDSLAKKISIDERRHSRLA
ncbi:hypothetical protein [Burkholderia vietnamiensis]|uniref:hypothetical protein n=1 Tax=Burkholderia vietnamiensis TaxID=60552 RepID=UPI001CF2945E|nr:hypothetical protein [Burkholderia vietnamiensis]MCA7983706.1 hypothetical protein [Burkholderia vietnamiensis]